MSINQERVLILDYGSQYTQLIARRCREEGVFSSIERWDHPLESIREQKPIGIILSGGPSSVYDGGTPRRLEDLFELDIPILGICYGMQLLTLNSGGRVDSSPRREYGRATVKVSSNSRLFKGLESEERVWMSHGDHVTSILKGWPQIAVSDSGVVAGIEHPKLNLFGVQFHPEVSHTLSGAKIIRNFLYGICNASGGWSMGSFASQTIKEMREKVGDERVICAFSGGVDSTVAATLLHQAIGDQLRCVLVDNGLMRKNEAENIRNYFGDRFGESLVIADASKEFLNDLKGVVDPEKKRKIIGHRFIDVFLDEAKKFKGAKYLLQGSLYPDVIESAQSHGPAAVIKTHHNVGGLPEQLGIDLLEPVRDLFKDEVRLVGRELDLPEQVVMRHPFPGPGLAVRIIGEITAEKVRILQEADAIFIEELHNADWYRKVSQALAVLLPIQSVGVMGDARTYEQVIALRSVDTRDFMTADFSPLPHELLARISTRITGEVRGINRVVYDVTSKPPGTVEWE